MSGQSEYKLMDAYRTGAVIQTTKLVSLAGGLPTRSLMERMCDFGMLKSDLFVFQEYFYA
jgi:hypothetical protein